MTTGDDQAEYGIREGGEAGWGLEAKGWGVGKRA
jgi:hypothetical protein